MGWGDLDRDRDSCALRCAWGWEVEDLIDPESMGVGDFDDDREIGLEAELVIGAGCEALFIDIAFGVVDLECELCEALVCVGDGIAAIVGLGALVVL